MPTNADWESSAVRYRKQRNAYLSECRFLRGRLDARNCRIRELKDMLEAAGIDWRARDEQRRQAEKK